MKESVFEKYCITPRFISYKDIIEMESIRDYIVEVYNSINESDVDILSYYSKEIELMNDEIESHKKCM